MPEMQVEAGREEHKYYPYTGIFYANRHSFWNAGQDSWTLPPAQNPDMFLQLNNVEPVLQGILQRRRGYTLFTSLPPHFGDPFTLGYSFRSENKGLRSVVFSSISDVHALGEDGSTILDPIFFPTNGAAAPRMVLSRDYGYFYDTIAADNKKWDGTTGAGNLTNTGIDVSNVLLFTVGPNSPGTVGQSGSGTAWINTANATGSCDGTFASCQLTPHTSSQTLVLTNFLFPAGPLTGQKIQGISVNITWSRGGFANRFASWRANLTFDGGITFPSISHVGGNLGSISGTATLGGPSDLWGTDPSPNAVEASTFGVGITFSNQSSTATSTLNIDCITVLFTLAPSAITVGTPSAAGGTNVNLLNGRTYFYAFQNANTGHVSSLSPASLSTGPVTGNSIPLTNIPTSLDPQVTNTLILATADGNDQTTLFLLDTLPAGTSSYTDNIPDNISNTFTSGITLLTNPLYLDTDQAGVIHGIANNNRPPAITFPTKHKGRIYGAIGRALFFSKNLDETTTANGLITSKWEEAWPATNQFDISEQAETIQGILSDGETLWVATERAIRRIIGDSPSNFQKPEIQFNEVGLLNQEVWKVVFMEGQPVGTMWLTPDFRVIASDFNTYLDVGTPIQDVLNSINPAAAGTAHACYVNKGPADYYMLYIPTGSNTLPDTCCVYNLRSKKWFIWTPTDQVTASLFLIDGSGQARWLFATLAGPLYEWLSGSTQDRLGNTPVTYPVTLQTTWLDFGDYVLRKFVNQIIPTTADQTGLTVAVEAASNELDFITPLQVVPATAVVPAAIPTDVFVPLASGPSHSRAFRFTFVSPPSTIANILTGFSIEAGGFHKY